MGRTFVFLPAIDLMEQSILVFLFWLGLFIVFYSYVGYGMLLWLLTKIKRTFNPYQTPSLDETDLPEVTFVVAAWNEEDWIEEKVQNCLDFDYPRDKITILFVTDGSTDATPTLIENYPKPNGAQVEVYHKDGRSGKIAAVHRIMEFIRTPYVIFTDANTMVNKEAIRMILRHYQDPQIGAVAGEKRISIPGKAAANSAGEGFYWKYESKLKQWDAELYSVVGAAGELFSIKTDLYEPVAKDTIVEDFVMTLRIAQRGYKVAYEPGAYAVESSSASIAEELKRKIRIAAGAFQAVTRLSSLLNIFKHGVLTFQYVSHRVLRWTLAPLALPIIFITNLMLVLQGASWVYTFLFIGQCLFYSAALLGWFLERRQIKLKLLFVPFYFCMMNYAVFRGFARWAGGRQSVVWEKAKRATTDSTV